MANDPVCGMEVGQSPATTLIPLVGGLDVRVSDGLSERKPCSPLLLTKCRPVLAGEIAKVKDRRLTHLASDTFPSLLQHRAWHSSCSSHDRGEFQSLPKGDTMIFSG